MECTCSGALDGLVAAFADRLNYLSDNDWRRVLSDTKEMSQEDLEIEMVERTILAWTEDDRKGLSSEALRARVRYAVHAWLSVWGQLPSADGLAWAEVGLALRRRADTRTRAPDGGFRLVRQGNFIGSLLPNGANWVASRETVTVVKAHQAAVGNEATVDEGEQVDVIEEAKNYFAVIKKDGSGGWVPRPCIVSSASEQLRV